jgi:hypothetical protein
VHARLVADLHRHRQVYEAGRQPLDNDVLGVVAEIAVVEIAHVDVVDAGEVRPAGEPVPHQIVERPRTQQMVRQPVVAQAGEDHQQQRARADKLRQRPAFRRHASPGITQKIVHAGNL